MKYILIGILTLMVPLQYSYANTVVRSGDTVTLADNQSIEGSFYAVGGTVALSGAVTGDTTVIGGNVTVGGEVSDDLSILAGTVSLQSPVGEDVRIVAGQVTITENIAGDLVVVAGKLTISSSAKISGDVLFYGGEMVVEGEVAGRLLGSAETVRVDALVAKGIDMKTRALTLGEQANVTGDVSYTSTSDIVRAPGAVVTGNVLKNAEVAQPATDTKARTIAITFLISLFATLSFYLIFRRLVESFGVAVRRGLVVKTAIGFVFVFMMPLVVTILIVSVLGFVVGLVALAALLLLLVLALPLVAVTAGSLLAQLIDKKSTLSIPYLILGGVVVTGCLFVPIIGLIAVLWLYMATVGTLVDQVYKNAR